MGIELIDLNEQDVWLCAHYFLPFLPPPAQTVGNFRPAVNSKQCCQQTRKQKCRMDTAKKQD